MERYPSVATGTTVALSEYACAVAGVLQVLCGMGTARVQHTARRDWNEYETCGLAGARLVHSECLSGDRHRTGSSSTRGLHVVVDCSASRTARGRSYANPRHIARCSPGAAGRAGSNGHRSVPTSSRIWCAGWINREGALAGDVGLLNCQG